MILAVYSWSGGVGKTTSAVALACHAAAQGRTVVLIDADPRAAATKWAGVQPREAGLHVGAILAAADPTGWVQQLAVPTLLHERILVVPSHVQVANRDHDQQIRPQRLAHAIQGCTADLIIIDAPNRLNGQIIENVLAAADTVVLAATATEDGAEGVEGAAQTISAMSAATRPRLAGIIATAVRDVVQTRVQRSILAGYAQTGLLLAEIPHRVAVQEARRGKRWIAEGDPRGDIIRQAYAGAYDRLTQK